MVVEWSLKEVIVEKTERRENLSYLRVQCEKVPLKFKTALMQALAISFAAE